MLDGYSEMMTCTVKLSPNIAKTVKGKLWLGTKLVQFGGSEKIFHKMFNLEQGDKLLNSAHCYLSTTAGPIAGLVFVSTHVVAFCSDRPIIISSPHGEVGKVFYKVNNISFLQHLHLTISLPISLSSWLLTKFLFSIMFVSSGYDPSE